MWGRLRHSYPANVVEGRKATELDFVAAVVVAAAAAAYFDGAMKLLSVVTYLAVGPKTFCLLFVEGDMALEVYSVVAA